MTALTVFAHGKESGPWGTKIQYLAAIARRRGVQVESPDYTDLMDPDARVERLLALPLPPHDRLILVGSSMGGYVSTLASAVLQPAGLFLMAPAFYLSGYHEQSPCPRAQRTEVVFGWNDEVVPPENGMRFAHEHRASLHMLDADHRLDGVLEEVGWLFERFLEKVLG